LATFTSTLVFSLWPEQAEETAEFERRLVANDRRGLDPAQFHGFGVGILDFPGGIDEVGRLGVLAGNDAAIGEAVAEFVLIEFALAGDDADEFAVGIHDHLLHVVLFLLGEFARAGEHVLELAAFESDGGEADLVEKLLVVERLHDHADRAGERGVIGHEPVAGAGDVITAGGGERAHVDDDGLLVLAP
jgi:hypothetical protein